MVILRETEERKRRRESHSSDEEEKSRKRTRNHVSSPSLVRLLFWDVLADYAQKGQQAVASSAIVGSLHRNNLHSQLLLTPSPPLSPSPVRNSSNLPPLLPPALGRQTEVNFDLTNGCVLDELIDSLTEARRGRNDQSDKMHEMRGGNIDWTDDDGEILDESGTGDDFVRGMETSEGI